MECPLNPANLPNEDTNECLEALSRKKDVDKIMLIIHGFLKSFDTPWLHEMQREIMRQEPNTAVIVSFEFPFLPYCNTYSQKG